MQPESLPRGDPGQVVDRQSPLPVYFQIALDVRRRIAAGEWSTGQRIAPELTLAREYDVSRVTVRQALAELVKDDLLERQRGSGTYVRDQQRPLVYDLNITVGQLAARWREAQFDNRAEVIEVGTVASPSDELRLRLQIEPSGTALYMIRRIIINDEPACLYRSWFNGALAAGLERSTRLNESLSTVLAEDFVLVPVRSENQLEVIRSTREEASLLQAAGDVPLFVVTATTYLADSRPLEHAQISWLGDRVRFHVTAFTQAPSAGNAVTPSSGAGHPLERGLQARNRRGRATPGENG